jgi:hypothetical protein
MGRVQELISVLSDSNVIARTATAKANQRCKICGNPAKSFRTTRSELEYNISGICQSCQDYYFGDGIHKN